MAETADRVSIEKGTANSKDLCPVCKWRLDDCVCCPECGHACPLDADEPYCPVCSP